MKNFIVIRMANKQDGTFSCPTYPYETEVEAWKNFFRYCGFAVDSDNLKDTVVLMTADGFQLEHRAFVHDPIPEEPEEPEPEEQPLNEIV